MKSMTDFVWVYHFSSLGEVLFPFPLTLAEYERIFFHERFAAVYKVKCHDFW